MCLVDPYGGLDEATELEVARTRFELDAEAVASRPFRTPFGRKIDVLRVLSGRGSSVLSHVWRSFRHAVTGTARRMPRWCLKDACSKRSGFVIRRHAEREPRDRPAAARDVVDGLGRFSCGESLLAAGPLLDERGQQGKAVRQLHEHVL